MVLLDHRRGVPGVSALLLGLDVVHHGLGYVTQPARFILIPKYSLNTTLRGTLLNDVLDAELSGARSQRSGT